METTGTSVTVPTPPKIEEPSTRVSVEEFTSYDEARDAYAQGYEFEKMLAWVSRQPWANRPGGLVIQRHWEKLVEMKAFLFEGVANLSQTEEVDGVEVPPLTALSLAISKMKPIRFRAFAVGIAAKTDTRAKLKPLLTEFDLEYTGGGLGRLVKTISK